MTIDPTNLAGTAHLTFADEFNSFQAWNGTTGWDTKWYYNPPEGGMGYNNELQWYINAGYAPTSSVVPWVASGGILSLTARTTPAGISSAVDGASWVSGMINSYHQFSQAYGYFEMRAKLPAGQGLWPAFWLLREDDALSSEIDIMEMLGQEPQFWYSTVHSFATGTIQSTSGTHTGTDTSAAFHNFGLNWTPTTLTFYQDGVPFYSRATPSDMQVPMYIICNLAVGGDNPGPPDGTTPDPATMQIEYIRVYADGPSSASPGAVAGVSTVSAIGRRGARAGGTAAGVGAALATGNALGITAAIGLSNSVSVVAGQSLGAPQTLPDPDATPDLGFGTGGNDPPDYVVSPPIPSGWAPHGVEDYADALSSFLPTGPAWPRDRDGVQTKFLTGLAGTWGGKVDPRAADLLTRESDPRATLEMLFDWERAWGLPDPCVAEPLTIADRRRALLTRMTMIGGQSRAFFIAVAASIGYQITIREWSPFMAGVSHAGDTRPTGTAGEAFRWEVGAPEMRFYWSVKVDAKRLTWFRAGYGGGQAGIDPHLRIGLATDLECLLRRWAPAHTEVLFDYSGLGASNPTLPGSAGVGMSAGVPSTAVAFSTSAASAAAVGYNAGGTSTAAARSVGEDTRQFYFTGYGSYDNDPAGFDIAYPNARHPMTGTGVTASCYGAGFGGSGTYQYPIPLAADIRYVPAGTVIYIPHVQVYGEVVDYCQASVDRNDAGNTAIQLIDIWVGGDLNLTTAKQTTVNNASNALTHLEPDPPAYGIVNPVPGKTVRATVPISGISGTCSKTFGPART